jgi:hypothetical protein
MERGGRVFTATAVSGTDADCAQAATGDATAIASDTVSVVKLASGEVACVSTPSQRRYELLWHARGPRSGIDQTAPMANNHR